MNKKTARIMCAFVLGAALMADSVYAGSPVTAPDEMAVRMRQSEFTITCPNQMTYQAQPIAEWNAGMHSIKQMKFTDASVTGRILNCNYSANGGADWSVLMREMPAGYVCTSDNKPGSKNWQFLCKRAVGPIKIKPKS